MDPRVMAIMAQLQSKEEDHSPTPVLEKEKPPKTFEEFMKVEGLTEWPQRLTSEGALDLEGEILLLGSQEEIADLLRESAPLGLNKLEELELRLDELEGKLHFYSDQIVSEAKQDTHGQDRLFFSPSKTFLTEMSESDAVKSHHSARGHKTMDFAESMMETRKKSLEYCQFPGFRVGELIELPGQMESPPILHRVTKAQDFNPGFKKFWKKLFLSEASVAMMQDTFWWFFLSKYDPNRQEDLDLLFDRIADSFVGLFTSIHTDVKDKFLAVYPDCLAQAVFMAYWEAFPESRTKMDEQFKQDLINTVVEWITGLRPMPSVYKSWNVKRMEAKHRGVESQGKDAKKMMVTSFSNDMKLSLDIDSFNKLIDKIWGVENTGNGVSSGPTPLPSREVTKLTNASNMSMQSTGMMNQQLEAKFSRGSPSRMATCGTPRRKPKEYDYPGICIKRGGLLSHQIGPGPEYERVMFNTSGRSPLISHFLHMRQLKDFHQPGRKVRRTEIVGLPKQGPTYKQLIKNSLAMSDALKKEYQKICDQTHQEIMELERKQRDSNREINDLKRELMLTKDPYHLKILSERILGLREVSRQGRRKSSDRERELTLLEGDGEGSEHGYHDES
ncbi:protein FAM227B-like isoform X2 [Mizuhopecten yessoensis]|uniref:protein FAM227B-like isoform X2 n=1 Tax=Mizuhopecten yessoensis TaxID=6573 RepID=UPI000B45CF39|nr:protein FAM227B-like isoform X2 [Mizuhopecten yessoensis]